MKSSFLPRMVRRNAARRRWRKTFGPLLMSENASFILGEHELELLGLARRQRRRARFGGRLTSSWLDWRSRLADKPEDDDPSPAEA